LPQGTIPAAPCRPYGTSTPLGSQSPGAASPERASVRLLRLTCRRNRPAGPAGSKGSTGIQWAAMGIAPEPSPGKVGCLLPCACGERTQQRLAHLALASLGLRSARVLTGLYSAFANPVLERLGYDAQHEAHFARRGSIGDNCFAADLMAAPVSCCAGRSRGPMGPMPCAGPSGGVLAALREGAEPIVTPSLICAKLII
jgi:hypothetical protein